MLCADDFGVSPGVSQAIARLAGSERLGAASCITTGRHWRAQAPRLRDLPASVQIGLHFNLSEGQPLSPDLARTWPQFPALPRLIALAHLGLGLGLLPRSALAAEFTAQWDAFVLATGHAPHYVDGHQHVHHLPGVRELLLAAVPPALPMRNTGHVLGPAFAVKRWLIERTGGTALQRALAQRGTPHNTALLGVYDFQASDYRRLMQHWLARLPAEGGLLFCHPGDAGGADGDAADPIAAARLREAAYLGSAAFADDLAAAHVRLGAAWHRLND